MVGNNIKVIAGWALVIIKTILLIGILPLIVILYKSGAID